MSKEREIWVDYIKVIACVLVVLGHFFQSMVRAGILGESGFCLWFDTTVYYFHVPLFFICSGYLYQQYGTVDSLFSWKRNAVKKAVALGVPYFAFSGITWLFKTVFANSVNTRIGGLAEVLFVEPCSPYWFLYVLFFLFLLIPTISSKKSLITLLLLSAAAKLAVCALPELAVWRIYAVQGVFSYSVWFVLGMGLSVIGAGKLRHRALGVLLAAGFIALSFVTVKSADRFVDLGMAALACTAVFSLMVFAKDSRVLDAAVPYTFPVFLMHTLTAAPLRLLLMKAGCMSPYIHIPAGILAGFLGPVIAIKIMEKIRLDVLVYPGRYFRL